MKIARASDLITNMDGAKSALDSLYAYCQQEKWMGYDPFDGLSSRVFQAFPVFKNNRIFRLAFLQLNKRSWINFRPMLGVPKGRNPKAIGLFLRAVLDLYNKERNPRFLQLIRKFMAWLKEDISPGFSGACWGYNFDWQNRAFFLPKGTPTVVNTSFIGKSFLRAYEILGEDECLHVARSACDFILRDLKRLEMSEEICFSYSPLDNYFVHNATALAASLLAWVSEKTGEERLAGTAKKSIQYVINHQRPDGAWIYGESPTARRTGIDNFHTGYILESLKIYADSTRDVQYEDNIRKGLDFYQRHFFSGGEGSKYFVDRSYPLDVHCAAQAIITCFQLQKYGADPDLSEKVMGWMIRTMRDNRGFFYYQKNRHIINKIPYMRWSQAWAFLALTTYLTSHA